MRRAACCVLRVAFGLGLCGSLARADGPEKLPPLLPPHGELRQTFWELHGWQCVAGAVVALGIIVAGIIWLRRPRQLIVEPPGVLARRALELLRGRPEDGALVMNVSRILKRYVMAALNLPPEELTTTEFRQTLQAQPEIKPDLAAATGEFLKRCDEWKFAPERPTPQLGAVEGALELVEKLELSRQPVADKEAA